MVTHGDVATGVYVDGMNLFYGALKGTADKWLDLRAFVHLLVPDDEIVAIRRRGQRRTGLATVMIEEEKRTDVNIAVQMVEDSARGLVDKILLVSNDSDLTEAVLATERFGVPVGIVNPHRTRTSHHLTGSASFEIVLRRTALTRCQFPNVVNGPNGRSVRRPTQWL